jgi:hypothetical protein
MVGGGMLIVTLVAFFTSNGFATLKLAFNFWDPFQITQFRLSHLSAAEYQASIEQALVAEEFEEAQNMVALAHDYGHELPSDLVERTHENPFEFGVRHMREVVNGAVTGEVTSAPSIGGVLAADFFVVGDLRDVVIQGSYLVQGRSYDKITLGLSLAGLVTSVGSLIPNPGTPAAILVDPSISLIKTANKAKKLTKPLQKHVWRISNRLIDVEGVKQGLKKVSLPTVNVPSISAVSASVGNIEWRMVAKGDFSGFRKLISEMMPFDIKATRDAFKGAVRKEVVNEVKILSTSAGDIRKAGGIKATFRALEYSDDAKELSRFRSLAVRMGEKSSAAIKILGKSAIKLGKLIYLVLSVLIAVTGWIFGALWFGYSMIRSTRRLVGSSGS